MDRKAGVSLLAAVGVSLVLIVARAGEALAQTAPATAELRISGAVTTPLVLTIADLKNMPRKKLSVVNPHDKKTENYEGVLLEELLRKAGVPQGGESARVFDGHVCLGGSGGRIPSCLLVGRTGFRDSRFRCDRGGYDGRRATGGQSGSVPARRAA